MIFSILRDLIQILTIKQWTLLFSSDSDMFPGFSIFVRSVSLPNFPEVVCSSSAMLLNLVGTLILVLGPGARQWLSRLEDLEECGLEVANSV